MTEPNIPFEILLQAMRDIADMTDADNDESYRADDSEGCLDTVNAKALRAIREATTGDPEA